MMARRSGAAAALALVLCGCAAPALVAPPLDVPAAYREQETAAQWAPARMAEAQPRGAWWTVFNDPALDAYIAAATGANTDLAVAAARVSQARALAGISEAARWVNVDAQAGVSRARSSNAALGLPQDTVVRPATVAQAQLAASYEVDLFGRVARGVDAAQADAEAGEATYRSVLLALQADVAQTWFQLRAAHSEQAILARTIALREENVRIGQRRFDAGDVGELDLARARTELSTTRADALALERQRAGLEHALAVLLGQPTGAFRAGRDLLPDAASLPGIPAGLPSTLLERRPDITAAQRAMVAANARIGVARAARFPLLQLTAAGGAGSVELSDLFRWSSRTWLAGALASVPLVDGGRARAEIARSEAVLAESAAAYRRSVLRAFADVDDNLAGLRTLAGQAEQVGDAAGTARRAAQLAQTLYQAGHSSYLDVLDAQRNLLAIERSAVQLQGQRAVTTVALIRALGGAWGGAG